ncbi:MAG: phenylalanine--tRNA ligase subunit alpha, partial [Alphaproteobacteria bacterium]|nr:phenylalanine--tRNA ligase subunit alpha [Alphaproteobacteria bacterium]
MQDLNTLERDKVKGPIINGMRDRVTAALAARKSALGDAALEAKLKAERVDVTLPARPEMTGRMHPVSQILDEATAIFADMGFA